MISDKKKLEVAMGSSKFCQLFTKQIVLLQLRVLSPKSPAHWSNFSTIEL